MQRCIYFKDTVQHLSADFGQANSILPHLEGDPLGIQLRMEKAHDRRDKVKPMPLSGMPATKKNMQKGFELNMVKKNHKWMYGFNKYPHNQKPPRHDVTSFWQLPRSPRHSISRCIQRGALDEDGARHGRAEATISNLGWFQPISFFLCAVIVMYNRSLMLQKSAIIGDWWPSRL